MGGRPLGVAEAEKDNPQKQRCENFRGRVESPGSSAGPRGLDRSPPRGGAGPKPSQAWLCGKSGPGGMRGLERGRGGLRVLPAAGWARGPRTACGGALGSRSPAADQLCPGLSGLSFPPAWIQGRLRGPPGEPREGRGGAGGVTRGARKGSPGARGHVPALAEARGPEPGSPRAAGSAHPAGRPPGRRLARRRGGERGPGGLWRRRPREGVARGDVAGQPHCADPETEAAAAAVRRVPGAPGEATAVFGRWRVRGPRPSPPSSPNKKNVETRGVPAPRGLCGPGPAPLGGVGAAPAPRLATRAGALLPRARSPCPRPGAGKTGVRPTPGRNSVSPPASRDRPLARPRPRGPGGVLSVDLIVTGPYVTSFLIFPFIYYFSLSARSVSPRWNVGSRRDGLLCPLLYSWLFQYFLRSSS